MFSPVIEHAQALWNYMSAGRKREKSDVIVVCCSYDLRVADYACDLLKSGLAKRILFSGNTGNWTRHLWNTPEAHIFRDRALSQGIPEDVILIEDKATNFGENIAFSSATLPWAKRAIFVTKPSSILRVSLTIPIQWPGITAFTDSPLINFPDEVSNVVGILGVIDEMVGDIHRIINYPKKGFQIPHELPSDIIHSWQFLLAEGFRNHLLPGTPTASPNQKT